MAQHLLWQKKLVLLNCLGKWKRRMALKYRVRLQIATYKQEHFWKSTWSTSRKTLTKANKIGHIAQIYKWFSVVTLDLCVCVCVCESYTIVAKSSFSTQEQTHLGNWKEPHSFRQMCSSTIIHAPRERCWVTGSKFPRFSNIRSDCVGKMFIERSRQIDRILSC